MMKIGFEAKRIYNNHTGLGHYSRTLVSSLATYFPEDEYVLFTPATSSLYHTDKFDHMKVVTPNSLAGQLLKSIWRSNWVKKDLQREKIDVYHGLSHEIPMGLSAIGIPSVVTMHDLIFERYPEQYHPIDIRIYRQKFKYACKHANKIIAISEQTKQDLMQFYGVPEEQITVCYQSCHPAFGVQVSEAEKHRVRELYGLPKIYFLYVGSIIERKNLLLICKGLQQVKHLNIPLVVIGEGGKYKQTVQAYIKAEGLSEQVIFLSDKHQNASFKTAQDFPAIYQQALCMIYPSVFEGFGIPVLEALWSKIPVITSNVSCMPETGGKAAFYIDPNSVEEMAGAMHAIATNTTLRENMVLKGWEHAQYFSQQACATAVHKVYQEVCKHL